MTELTDSLVCRCGDPGDESGDGLTKAEKLLLVYKELVRTAESIGQNLPDAVPKINMEQARGGDTVTLSVAIN